MQSDSTLQVFKPLQLDRTRVERVIRARTCVPNIRIPIFFAFRLQRFARQRYYANFNILKIWRIFAIFALDSNSNTFFSRNVTFEEGIFGFSFASDKI